MPLDDLRTLRNAPGLTTFQQGFLDDFADLVRSLAVAQLDPGQITGTVGGKPRTLVYITLPHRADARAWLIVVIEPTTVVFSYGVDHRHFGYGEPDPPVTEALNFAQDFLMGRIEIEIEERRLLVRTSTIRVSEGGIRERLQRSYSLRSPFRQKRRRTYRISFQ